MYLYWANLSYKNPTKIFSDSLLTKQGNNGQDYLTGSNNTNKLHHILSEGLWTEASKGTVRNIYGIYYQQSTTDFSNSIWNKQDRTWQDPI